MACSHHLLAANLLRWPLTHSQQGVCEFFSKHNLKSSGLKLRLHFDDFGQVSEYC